MAVFRVEKTRDYTVMANHHLRNKELSLKAKGLLSLMLSLPEDWDYTTKGLSFICKDGVDSICATVKELENHGYVTRRRIRNEKGQLTITEYTILEQPVPSDIEAELPKRENPVLDNPILGEPVLDNPVLEKPEQAKPILENPAQLNTNRSKTNPESPKKINTHAANSYQSNPNPSYQPPVSWDTGLDGIRCDEAEQMRETVMENIEYDILIQDPKANRERLDEIVDLMVETLCSTKPSICVAGDDYPASLVKERLLRLNSMHIDYVFE